jgi:hypothetical protein
MLIALLKRVLYQTIMATRSKHRIRGTTFSLGSPRLLGFARPSIWDEASNVRFFDSTAKSSKFS